MYLNSNWYSALICTYILIYNCHNTYIQHKTLFILSLAFAAIYIPTFNKSGFQSTWNCWGSSDPNSSGCQTSLTINIIVILLMQIIFGLLPEYIISYSLYHFRGNVKNKYPVEYDMIRNNDMPNDETDERKNGNSDLPGLYPKQSKVQQSYMNGRRPGYEDSHKESEVVVGKLRDCFYNPVEMDLKLLFNPFKYLRFHNFILFLYHYDLFQAKI